MSVACHRSGNEMADEEVRRGREAFAERAWQATHAHLARAAERAPLEGGDLELLATSIFMLGHEEEWTSHLERAHQAHLDAGEPLRAARCATWIGLGLAVRGEVGPASGWWSRAQRLVERESKPSVERGYLLLPVMIQQEKSGQFAEAEATAAAAAEIGERFDETDLVALAIHAQGRALTKQGRVEEGLALLDEAMVAVTAGELSPVVTGLIYCSVIEGCHDVFELRRAREWTAALTQWCAGQPDLVTFNGTCLIHRAEILQLQGTWPDALAEARQASERYARQLRELASGQAHYQQGEILRLQGANDQAEESYRTASRLGWQPQPGLALLRLQQGKGEAAASAIRRAVGETDEPLALARLLPAYVEIMLAIGDTGAARRALDDLEGIAERYERRGMLAALSAQARGAVELSGGDCGLALRALRQAQQAWQELDAPYEVARTRVLVALACRALEDADAATMELDAARSAFEQLGAAPDLARVEVLAAPAPGTHGLTGRELEVLRLVAAGHTNRAIAAELVISEHTVARHVQNIFAKLGLSSRTAASAFAYEHELL
jgi:DNA-binding NarL/FixJ family response regulator